MRAELEAAHQELVRTERLVEIGAASKQELERIRAQHTVHETGVQGARAALTLLGLGADRARRSDKTCATEVVFPDYGIKQALPLNQGVAIEFTPHRAGEVAFACGMGMLKGTVTVQ